jgi:undecaprenol kinase
MPNFLKQRITSFKYAFSGCWYVVQTQKNAWIHLLATILTLTLAIWLQLKATEWAILVLTIIFVWTSETINTSVELIVDLVSPEKKMLAKIIKDVGAASVLITAIGSIIIGMIIFGPPLLLKLIFLLTPSH